MIPLIAGLNRLATGLFDLFLFPFGGRDPLWALGAAALAGGLLLTGVHRFLSNPRALGRTRDRIQGMVLGIWLYRHDPGTLWRLQVDVLKEGLRYLRGSAAALPPLILLGAILFTQLDVRFSRRPLGVGEAALVKVRVLTPSALSASIRLEGSPGLQVESRAVRIVSLGEAVWRVRASEPGAHRVVVHLGRESLSREIVAGASLRAIPVRRMGRPAGLFLQPGESPLPEGSAVESIEVAYPERPIRLGTWRIHWLVPFSVFSLTGVLGARSLIPGILGRIRGART